MSESESGNANGSGNDNGTEMCRGIESEMRATDKWTEIRIDDNDDPVPGKLNKLQRKIYDN